MRTARSKIRTARLKFYRYGGDAFTYRLPESVCEISKYAAGSHPDIKGLSGRTRIKQMFRPQPKTEAPWYPPKWMLMTSIQCRSLPRRFTQRCTMKLSDYQAKRCLPTEFPFPRSRIDASRLVPLLGLAGEAGQLLSEYKKRLRDGPSTCCSY